MRIKFDNQKGTTLIELLASLVIIGFIISSLYTIFNFGLTAWESGQKSSEDQQTARLILHRLTDSIKVSSKDDISLFSNNDILIGTDRFRLVGSDLRNQYHNPIASGIDDMTINKIYLDSNSRSKQSVNNDNWNLIKISITMSEGGEELITYAKPRN